MSGKKGKKIDLEDIDTDEHMYILRRVSKAKLKAEAKDTFNKQKKKF